MALVNATGLRRGSAYTSAAWRSEVLLLSTHAVLAPGGNLRLGAGFSGSASHLQKFVVESLGLATMTAVARHEFGFNRAGSVRYPPIHIDNLPVGTWLRPMRYGPSGLRRQAPRPDLAYRVGKKHWIIGESRGRREPLPSLRPRWDETHRLNEIETWHQFVQQHKGIQLQWFLSWVWVDQQRTAVDFFDPEGSYLDLDAEADDYLRQLWAGMWEDAGPEVGEVSGHALRGAWLEVEVTSENRLHIFLGTLSHPMASFDGGPAFLGPDDETDALEAEVWGRLVAASCVAPRRPSNVELLDALARIAPNGGHTGG
jgi:hypothetical protein